MGAACVSCHNAHPESPKHDWKVGDVRGIQEVTITPADRRQHLLVQVSDALFRLHGGVRRHLHRPAAAPGGRHHRHEPRAARPPTSSWPSLSMKISRYLSPQIYKSIFSGQKDVTIHTERKKLTIFFSDIKDFTATTERLQPEQITAAAQRILHRNVGDRARAWRHRRQVHRRRDPDLLRRSGDQGRRPRTRWPACAWRVDMQRRLAELNAKWRSEGVEHPFRVRMGINTGYLQCRQFRQRRPHGLHDHRRARRTWPRACSRSPNPGISCSATRPMRWCATSSRAHALPPITMKGISREVVPYAVDGMLDEAGARSRSSASTAPGSISISTRAWSMRRPRSAYEAC